MFSSYIDTWTKEYSLQKKNEILDTSRDLYMDSFGFRNTLTKKRFMCSVLRDAVSSGRLDVFESLYIRVVEMNGMPIDVYNVNSVLVDYYSRVRQIPKAISICKETLKDIKIYLPGLREMQLSTNESMNKLNRFDEIGSLPDHIFCRDRLTFMLIDEKRFDEAEFYENLFHEVGLFPDKKDEKRVKYNKLCRLNGLVEFLLQNGNSSRAIEECKIILDLDVKSASYGFKKIGNYFLKNENIIDAYKYLKEAFVLNPAIEGIDGKLRKLSIELNLKNEVVKETIVSELELLEAQSASWFDKRCIAERYYSIKEYFKAIELFHEAIEERGRDNSLILGLSKAHKALGSKYTKDKRYDDALKHFLMAQKVLENPEFPISAIEKQNGILERMVKKALELKGNEKTTDNSGS